MFLSFKNVSVLRAVNKAHKLPCQGSHNNLREEETQNARLIPAKNLKLIRVLHTIRTSFTIGPGSLHTLCAAYHFRQHLLDLFNFLEGGIPTERKADEGVSQVAADSQR